MSDDSNMLPACRATPPLFFCDRDALFDCDDLDCPSMRLLPPCEPSESDWLLVSLLLDLDMSDDIFPAMLFLTLCPPGEEEFFRTLCPPAFSFLPLWL